MMPYLQRLSKSRLARLFAGTFVVGVVSRGLSLAMAVFLARTLAPAGYGTFTFATGLAAFCGQFAGIGWPGLMSRMIPRLQVHNELAKMRALVRWGDIVVLVGSVAAAMIVIGVMFLPVVRPELRHGIGLALVLLAPTAFNVLRQNQLAGAQKPAVGIALDQALPPAIVIGALLFLPVQSADLAVYILTGGTVAAAVLATIAMRRSLPRAVWATAPQAELKAWMSLALPLLIGQSTKLIMDRTDIMMLGPLSTFLEVGYYGSAFRLTYLMTFPQVMMMAVMTPIFSKKLAANEMPALWRHFRLAMTFSCLTALPLGLGLWIFRDPVLRIAFGSEFVPAATALSFLALSQAVYAASIPCSGLLIASGRTRAYGFINLGALLANASLNLLLIPTYGAGGAAMATAVSATIIALSLGAIVFANRKSLDVVAS